MFKKLINIKTILLIAITTSSCALSIPGTKIHDQEMQAIYDMTSSMNHNNNQGQDPHDVNDLRGCIIPFEISTWYKRDYNDTWGRGEKWLRGASSIISTGSTVDYKTSKNIHDLVTAERIPASKHSYDKQYYYSYIGPWKFSKKIGKKIRFVAYQSTSKRSGDGYKRTNLDYTFVSYDNFASRIKERPFVLREDYVLPTLDSLCRVKWMAKFGYNTIAETHYPGFFNKILKTKIKLTGKLIEIKD